MSSSSASTEQSVCFSVVLIAKNESKTLPRLLKSLEPFLARGGELVVVDTGSEDDTVAVAKSAGALVFECGDRFMIELTDEQVDEINEHVGDAVVSSGGKFFNFSAARNFAAQLASNDFVSMPDCDEQWSVLDIEYVNRMIIEQQVDQLQYEFVFSHDTITGEPTKQFRHSKFYSRKKLEWRGIIHEILQVIDKEQLLVEQYVGPDQLFLEHFQQQSESRRRYITGLAYEYQFGSSLDKGQFTCQSDRNLHYFGRELYYEKKYEAAIKVLQKHAEMTDVWQPEQANSMNYIGTCYGMLGDAPNKLLWKMKALELCECRHFMLELAQHWLSQKKWRQATAFAVGALELPKLGYYFENSVDFTTLPHEILYQSLWYSGNKARAKEHFRICYKISPEKYESNLEFFTLESSSSDVDLRSIDMISDQDIDQKDLIKQLLINDFSPGFVSELVNMYGVAKTNKLLQRANEQKNEMYVQSSDVNE